MFKNLITELNGEFRRIVPMLAPVCPNTAIERAQELLLSTSSLPCCAKCKHPLSYFFIGVAVYNNFPFNSVSLGTRRIALTPLTPERIQKLEKCER